MSVTYDVVVVGAGIVGSWAALNAAQMGKSVLLLEQFTIGHGDGSSHGMSRITRRTYPQPHFAKMTTEAFERWAELERDTGQKLYLETGGLMVGNLKGQLGDLHNNCKRLNTPHRVLSSRQITEEFGVKFPADRSAVLEKDAGILRADMCLKAVHVLLARYGVVVKELQRAKSIIPGKTVKVITTDSTHLGHSVILSPGSWIKDIGSTLGLDIVAQPQNCLVTYFKCDTDQYHFSKFPVFIDYHGDRSLHVYGLPCCEYPDHIKLCIHGGDKVDIATRTKNPSTEFLPALGEYISEHFPGVSPSPGITDACLYTVTHDENYILDSHPAHKNIVFGGGFSGHGFKLSPVAGKILAQLATGVKVSKYDISHFKLKRHLRRSSKL